MEPLPRGANFQRAKTLWEIGLDIAGDPATPYYGNRDMCIVVGSGSGEHFRPWLRLATGSPILAHAVVRGELEAAFVIPSGLLTQAYRGTGLFKEPLPVRVIASYPSWDRFVVAVHPRTGLTSLAQLAEKRQPLRLSIREDATHSTRVLLDQILEALGLTLQSLEAWGCTFQLNGPPGDKRRLDALAKGEVDLVLDEGIIHWLPQALDSGMQMLPLDPAIMDHLQQIGWRRVVIPASRFKGLKADYECIDYSGWPLYTRASLPDEDAYKICTALQARVDQIPWEDSFTGIGQLGQDTEATPLDVPLHPGAARWFREHGFIT